MATASPRRLLAAGLVALACWAGLSAPASALEFGGWYGRATLDAWHDDNLARQSAPRPSIFPRGNMDAGGNVGLALGTAFLLTPTLELWLTANARWSRAVVYPEWSGLSSGLFADVSQRWNPDTSSYLTLGSSVFWGGSPYHLAELGLERRAWPGAWLFGAASLSFFQGQRAETTFTMPGLSCGLQQSLPTGTRVAVSYGYQQRYFTGNRVEPQHQAFVLAGQRLSRNLELRARYGYTIATAPDAPYRNGYFTLGFSFEI